MQPEAPLLSWYIPEGQLKHWIDPLMGEYLICGQFSFVDYINIEPSGNKMLGVMMQGYEPGLHS